ncbi:MAG: isoprenylcysteine carboxylmethyltransferase family protein [Candidatus Aerophobetes bacterium]|nr:isoprenylcysteine carboxylmethyltransferase family protein [Candidatus Aerophobetes bacterium]
MWVYIICAIIWVFFLGILIPERRGKRIVSEIYGHCGISFFLTSLVLGLGNVGTQYDVFPLRIIGFILYLPAAFLVISPAVALKQKGKPKSRDLTTTTELVDTGIYQIVRHPMSLGMAIGAIGLMLTFQSLLSIMLGILAIFCLRIYSKKEDTFNIEQFGDSYREYMERVPMWNIFERIKKRESYKNKKRL